MASWHRFLVDFDGLGDASWHPKSHQNRSQEASQKGCQKVSILDPIFARLGEFQEVPGGGRATAAGENSGPLRKVGSVGKEVSVGK